MPLQHARLPPPSCALHCSYGQIKQTWPSPLHPVLGTWIRLDPPPPPPLLLPTSYSPSPWPNPHTLLPNPAPPDPAGSKGSLSHTPPKGAFPWPARRPPPPMPHPPLPLLAQAAGRRQPASAWDCGAAAALQPLELPPLRCAAASSAASAAVSPFLAGTREGARPAAAGSLGRPRPTAASPPHDGEGSACAG